MPTALSPFSTHSQHHSSLTSLTWHNGNCLDNIPNSNIVHFIFIFQTKSVQTTHAEVQYALAFCIHAQDERNCVQYILTWTSAPRNILQIM